MKKIITKADIALLIILILIGLALGFVSLTHHEAGQRVVVTIGGEEYKTYSLSTDREVTIKSHGNINKFIIKDKKVQMICANCKNQVCVNSRAISKAGETIVCLPNQVVIEIKGGGGYDAISK